MKLYLVRHAEAENYYKNHDSERTLNPRGYNQALTVGLVLQRCYAAKFDYVITSGYMRANQTANVILSRLENPPEIMSFAEFSPDGNPSDMTMILETLPQESNVLVVGHNPSISLLTYHLANSETLNVGFSNCTLVILEKTDETWHLVSVNTDACRPAGL